jgi:hypothetical protein
LDGVGILLGSDSVLGGGEKKQKQNKAKLRFVLVQ